MNRNTRITMEDSTMSAVMKLSGGNPGAISVCARMLNEGATIDPDDFLGGLGSVLALDSHAIYEDKIWMLYKDVCGESLVTMMGLLRGVQLGFMPEHELKASVAGHYGSMKQERIDGILKQVRDRLPAFAKA
jgi:hypothetical protein